MPYINFPRFYLIIDHYCWLEKFLPLGLKVVQLRIKNQPDNVIKTHISKAKDLCRQYNCILIINDYWKLALAQGCDYIHLGQEDLKSADIKMLKRKGVKLGISTHSCEELKIALNIKPDYIALGPIFHTKLKAMNFEPQGPEKLKIWKQIIKNIPLIAIGGITLEKAQSIYNNKADSICVVTDVLLHKNPKERLKNWLETANNKMLQLKH